MYFPGDPLLAEDPMYNCVPDERARRRLISALDWETTIPEFALGYRFDIVLRGPRRDADGRRGADRMSLHTTTSQTVGPYLHIGLTWLITEKLAPAGVPGERVSIRGRVLDGDGEPVNDALVEIWQADRLAGKYGGKRFRGFGRSATDDKGDIPLPHHQARPRAGPGRQICRRRISLAVVFMRGQLKHLVSRIYFPDEPANAKDAVLALVPKERRGTLIARKTGKPGALEWNVILQQERDGVLRRLNPRDRAAKPTDERPPRLGNF